MLEGLNLASKVRRGPRGDSDDRKRERREGDGCMNQVQSKVQEVRVPTYIGSPIRKIA